MLGFFINFNLDKAVITTKINKPTPNSIDPKFKINTSGVFQKGPTVPGITILK